MLITFIASLVILLVTSAYLLIISLLLSITGLPLALPFAPFLHLAVPVQPTARDTPSHSQPLALLPSHFLTSLTLSPVSILPALAGLIPTTTFSLSVLYSCLSFPCCLLLPHHLTCCLPYCLISPCLALLLLVWHLPSPNSLHCLPTLSHFTASFAVFLSHCHLPLWFHSFVLHPPLIPLCLPLLSLLLAALFPTMYVPCYFHSLPVLASPICCLLPPLLLLVAMFALYPQYLCLLFHLLLALAPQMLRTFLRSSCHAMVCHYLLPRLPSCLLLLLHLSPPVRSCPVFRQLSQRLPLSHQLPMLVHSLPVTIPLHHLTSPPYLLTASSCHSVSPALPTSPH